MKLRSALALALIVAANLFLVAAIFASSPHKAPLKLSLKVVIFEGSSYTFYPLGDDDGFEMGAVIKDFRRLPWYQPPEDDELIHSVSLRFKREETRARVTVFVHREDDAIKGEKIAEYVVAAGEECSVAELANYGIEPLRVGVIRRAEVRYLPPRVYSKAPSVEVVAVDARENVPSFELTLRNASEKRIKAVEIKEFRGEAPKGSPMLPNGVGKMFIAPGETWKVSLEFGWTHKVIAAGHLLEPPDRAVINSVVFSDNSYEGDVVYVANRSAIELGAKAQMERIVKLMREWRVLPDVSALEAARSLRAQIKALTVEAEASHLEELKGRYPALSAGEIEKVKAGFAEGAKWARSMARSDLKQVIKAINAETSADTFGLWLRQRRAAYEHILASYQKPPS